MSARHVPLKSVEFHVNDHLVECGATSWQIRNIAATSVGERQIPVNIPEPALNKEKPAFEFGGTLIGAAIAGFIVFAVVGLVAQSSNVGSIAGWLAFLGVIVWSVVSLNKRQAAWDIEAAEVAKQRERWAEIRQSPLILYSLMLETNAGSKPLFYSTDRDQIVRANNALKDAMTKRTVQDVTFNIDTLAVGDNAGANFETTVNNINSEIYKQEIFGA